MLEGPLHLRARVSWEKRTAEPAIITPWGEGTDGSDRAGTQGQGGGF